MELQTIDSASVVPGVSPTGSEFPVGDGTQFSVVLDGSSADEDFVLDSGASITGANVTLLAGDDLFTDSGTSVAAVTNLLIRGDHLNSDTGGTHINIEGGLSSMDAEITGESESDIIYLSPDALAGHTRVLGDITTAAGVEDTIIVDQLPSFASALESQTVDMDGDSVRDSLDLDGLGGTDFYIVNNTGNEDYVINVLDSGAEDDGIDVLTINATDTQDLFLLRKNLAGLGSVSKLNGLYVATVGVTSNGADAGFASDHVERVNYDASINGRVRLNAFEGDDQIFSDDNAAVLTIDGGDGEDYFQIGQMFKSERDLFAGIAAEDVFDTVETSRGFLSNGATLPITIYGGNDNDLFQVYHNKAVLRLEGGNHDDTFLVRAFVILDDSAKQAMTQINSGAGADNIQYAINAPVNIDGGDGFDTVVVVGTEFHDNFAITEDGVFGAGLNVNFNNTERLEIDGLEGDDEFFVLGTSDEIETDIIGNLGSDRFDISGDVLAPIVSDDLQGLSGVITHAAVSGDPAYDGIPIESILLRAAESTVAQVVITPSDGFTQVDEGGGTAATDTYEITLSKAPLFDVYLTVSAPMPLLEENAAATGSGVHVTSGGAPLRRAHVLKFTPTDWNSPRVRYRDSTG